MTSDRVWQAANQRDLVHNLERVRLLLEGALAPAVGEVTAPAAAKTDVAPSAAATNTRTEVASDDASDAVAGSAAESATDRTTAGHTTGPFALDRLQHAFGLSQFERDVVLLCAGMEMDTRFAPLVGAVLGDTRARGPTFGLALSLLPNPHWSALAPTSALRAWQLVELSGPGVATSALRIDERILHFLAGIESLDERLAGIAEPLAEPSGEPGTIRRSAESAICAGRALLSRADASPVVQLTATSRETRRTVAAGIARECGYRALWLDAAELPAQASERERFARLVTREAMLAGALLVVDVANESDARHLHCLTRERRVPVLVGSTSPVPSLGAAAPVLEVHEASRSERLALWQGALGTAAAGALNGTLDTLATTFELDDDAMRSVARLATSLGAGEVGPAIWSACRRAARARLDGIAQRIETQAGWNDIVLPPGQQRVLRDVVTHVRRRYQVYEEWGFATGGSRGLGLTALFAGASGTGKTMAAEVVARELALDLFRIDIAGVVSKYIGETEKNLRRLFDAAEGSGAILLFDEADAIFGKRSEVKDSHDRYANIEISYLLQRMEAYRGLAILTSNMKQALDSAFMRRIRFVVQFPFPDMERRADIWRGIFPAETPTRELDFTRLAQLNVAGGHIRNIALAGAFAAADRGEPVSMRLLADAARSELAKAERPLSEAELRGWT